MATKPPTSIKVRHFMVAHLIFRHTSVISHSFDGKFPPVFPKKGDPHRLTLEDLPKSY